MHKLKTQAHQLMNDSLYRNSIYLFVSNASLAATGFLFWTIAARLFPAAEVGVTSTIIAAATFIASASLFGLDHTLIHYLGKHANKTTAIIHTALTVVTIGAILFSIGYLLIVPAITPELAFILSSPLWVSAFIGLMVITAWNNILNSTFIAFRITHFILIAGLLFGIGRIILLALFNDSGLLSLLGSHSISFGAGVIAGLVSLLIAKKYVYKPHIGNEAIKLMRGYSLRTYVASLLASLPPLVTPLLVISLLGAPEAAYYSMPLLMVGLLNMIAMATSQSLFAEGIYNNSQIKKQVTKSVRLIYALLIPAVISVIGLGYFILNVFGASYAEHGYMLLVFLSVATLFKAGSFPLIAILRILGEIKEIIIATFVYVTCIILGTYVALITIGQLWAIGLAVLVSEALLLGIYAVVVRRKWKNSTKLTLTDADREIQI
jgi:O-antigen/teichoic acid export membrane protein